MRRNKIFPATSRRPSFGRLPLLVSLVGAVLLTLSSHRAEARILELYGDVYLGGMYGTDPKFNSTVTHKYDGTTRTDGADFFHDQSGGLLGGRVGIEILFTDVYLQFDQFVTPNGFSGSTLQAMIGWDLSIGDQSPGKWSGTLGAYGGMVFGFPYFPHAPIDTSQISTIGVTVEGQGGAEYNINRFLAFQIIGTVGYHYMFAGADAVMTSPGVTETTQTHGFHLMVKAGLRFHIGL